MHKSTVGGERGVCLVMRSIWEIDIGTVDWVCLLQSSCME